MFLKYEVYLKETGEIEKFILRTLSEINGGESKAKGPLSSIEEENPIVDFFNETLYAKHKHQNLASSQFIIHKSKIYQGSPSNMQTRTTGSKKGKKQEEIYYLNKEFHGSRQKNYEETSASGVSETLDGTFGVLSSTVPTLRS